MVGSAVPFQFTTAPDAKPAPFMVSVKPDPPAVADAGLNELIAGPATTVNVAGVEVTPPLLTVTFAVPGVAIKLAAPPAPLPRCGGCRAIGPSPHPCLRTRLPPSPTRRPGRPGIHEAVVSREVARATSDQGHLARAGGDLRPDVERVLASGEKAGDLLLDDRRGGAGGDLVGGRVAVQRARRARRCS